MSNTDLIDSDTFIVNNLLNKSSQVAVDSEQAEAIIYLATYYKNLGSFSTAEVFCNRLLGFVGPEGDEARALLREIRNRAQVNEFKNKFNQAVINMYYLYSYYLYYLYQNICVM